TSFDKRDFCEAESIYPPSVQIVRLRPSGNLILNCLKYLRKGPYLEFDVVHFHDFPMASELLYAIKLHLNSYKLVYSYHITNEFFTANNIAFRACYPFLFS